MKIELLGYVHDGDHHCGVSAAICYDSKTDRESSQKRLKSCMKHNHKAVLRFAFASFRISELSRKSADQLMRHAFISPLCESTRYVSKVELKVIMPAKFEDSPALIAAFDNGVKNAGNTYRELMNLGAKKEDAAYLLPLGFETNLQLAGNFQAWREFLVGDNSRLGRDVQAETRVIAIELFRALHEIAPDTFPVSLGDKYGIDIGEK